MAASFVIGLSVVFSIFGVSVSVIVSKYCLDKDCKEPIFQTKTISASTVNHPGTLSHNAGDSVEIFSIGSSDARYFWDGDIAGKTPSEPKKVYISKIDLTNFVKFFEEDKNKTLYYVTVDDSLPIESASIPANVVYADVMKDVTKYAAHFSPQNLPKTVSPLASIVKHEHHHHHEHNGHHHSHDGHDHSHSGHDHSLGGHGHNEQATIATNEVPAAQVPPTPQNAGSSTSADVNTPVKKENSNSVQVQPAEQSKNVDEYATKATVDGIVSSKGDVQGIVKREESFRSPEASSDVPISANKPESPKFENVPVSVVKKENRHGALGQNEQDAIFTRENPSAQVTNAPKNSDHNGEIQRPSTQVSPLIQNAESSTNANVNTPTKNENPNLAEVQLAGVSKSIDEHATKAPVDRVVTSEGAVRKTVKMEESSQSSEAASDVLISTNYPEVSKVDSVPVNIVEGGDRHGALRQNEQGINFAGENTPTQVTDVPKNSGHQDQSHAHHRESGRAHHQDHNHDVSGRHQHQHKGHSHSHDVQDHSEQTTTAKFRIPSSQAPPIAHDAQSPININVNTPMKSGNPNLAQVQHGELSKSADEHATKVALGGIVSSEGTVRETVKMEESFRSSEAPSDVPISMNNLESQKFESVPESIVKNENRHDALGQNEQNTMLTRENPSAQIANAPKNPDHRDQSHAHHHDESHAHPHDRGHAHHHDHSHHHDHNHDTSGHHHHHHGPTFGDKVADAAKATKTWAFWIKENLKPFVVGLKLALRPVQRLVPTEFQDFIGVRELIFTFLMASSFVYIFVQWTWRTFGGEEKQNLIALCKFAELYDKFKVLEIENEKLKKSNIDSEKFDAEIKKEKSICEAKSRECSRLMDDLNRLNAENKQLKEEISNLKNHITKLSDKSSFERELQQLKTTNSSLEIDLNEFKASFERERQIKERLEKENEKVSHDAAKLKEEKSKIDENLKIKNEELSALKEKNEELKKKCSEFEIQCKELEGLKLVLSRKQSLKQESKSKQQAKTSSDENESNGKDWDWADDVSGAESDAAPAAARNRAVDDKDDLSGLLSDDQLTDLVRLGSELKEKMDEIDRLKILIKDLMNEKQDLEKSCANLKMENETLTSSLRDANEKSLTLESKIKALKDIYEDQMKDLTKQLTKQQLEKEKQSSAMSNVEEDMNRIRDENSTLRKIDAELQAEIKELNNLYKKTRLELDRCIHEKWAESRRYEREKTAIQSENALLRARLVSNAPPMPRSDDEKNQPLSSPETGRQPTSGGVNPGDVSNNSSEAELAGITRASPIFPLKTPQLPSMPSYPPPPPMGMMPYGPPPPLSGYMSAGGGSSSFYGPFEDYRRASPAQSPRDFHYSSRHDMRGGQPRRNKSKARSNPSRSPSPAYGSSGPRRETSDYGLSNHASKNRRARSRGGASNRDRREESQSPPPPPAASSRRRHDARRGLEDDDDDYRASSSQQQQHYDSRHSASLYK